MKNKLILTALCLVATLVATAQSHRHEMSVNLHGGLMSLSAGLNGQGALSHRIGGGGGIGYAFKLNPQWAIATGIDAAYYSSEYACDRLENTYASQGVSFSYHLSDYRETASALLLEIPLMLRYSLPVSAGGQALRFAAGAKVGIPLSHRYTASAAGLQTTQALIVADDPNDPYTFTDAPVPLPEQKGELKTNVSVMLVLDVSYRLPLSERLGLSLGVFFQYGLNNMQGKNDGQMVSYSTHDWNLTHRPPQYQYDHPAMHTALVSALRPMAIGLKLGLDFW
jgi:hypothetical protein